MKHHRRIMDLGLGDREDSALAGILADLRANAERVHGGGAATAAKRQQAV